MPVELGTPGIAVGAAPARMGLEGFRPMNKFDISPIDKGGTRQPLGEIVFKQIPLTADSAIAAAENIIAEARVSVNPIIPRLEAAPVDSVITNEVRNLPTQLVIPDRKIATAPSTIAQGPRNDAEVWHARIVQPASSSQSEAVYAPFPQEQLIEEVIKQEQIRIGYEPEEFTETREQEDIEELKIRYVEDEAVSAQRRSEVKEAIKQAKLEAEEEGVDQIEGWRVKKYLPFQHQGNTSQIARGADGSLEETYQDLASRNYSSEEEANLAAWEIIEEKKPVKKAQEGQKVAEQDIARVRKDPIIKRHPVEEVVARIIKKTTVAAKPGQKAEVTSAVITEEFAEPTLQDLNLAEVFQKTA